jgi:cytochrome c oxidase cbb3-type subunit 4
MDLVTTFRAGSTVLTFVIFAGIVWWAYGSRRKARFEYVALSVLDDEDSPGERGCRGRGA